MASEILRIQLNRKIINGNNDYIETNPDKNDGFVVMDYYDELLIHDVPLTSDFKSIIGLGEINEIDESSISVQSFMLYYPDTVLGEKNNCCCIPEPEKHYKYIGIIQVHISPEIIRSIPLKSDMADNIDRIYRNVLFDTANKFACGNDISFKVYKMLSQADFAVVVRSNSANSIFRLSNYIRSTSATDAGGQKRTFFKTYTVFAVNISEPYNPDQMDVDLSVILRCCYSNLYWKDKIEVNGLGITNLLGRYDFSITLTEKEFLEILSVINDYKNGVGIPNTGNGTEPPKNQIDYLRLLMTNGYLSYINERYVFNNNVSNIIGNTYNISELLDASVSDTFLEPDITGYVAETKEVLKEAKSRISSLKEGKSSLSYYMDLIQRMIAHCQSMNGLSDIRIHAIYLLRQIGIILKSVCLYLDLNGDDIRGIRNLEEWVKKSISSFDSYAKYIRNNNLQSLQTPTFNIESNTSVDKTIIGYGQLLKIIADSYQKESSPEENKEYVPIVLPSLDSNNVSVEVLFEEGCCRNWEKELEYRHSQNIDKYCMVIQIPTLYDLSQVQLLIPSLMHEIGHRFRYESREDRNDFLVKGITYDAMTKLALSLIKNIQEKYEVYFSRQDIIATIAESFTAAVLQNVFQQNSKGIFYEYRSTPIISFQQRYVDDLEECFHNELKKNMLGSVCDSYIKAICRFSVPSDSLGYAIEIFIYVCESIVNLAMKSVLDDVEKETICVLKQKLEVLAKLISIICVKQHLKKKDSDYDLNTDLIKILLTDDDSKVNELYNECFIILDDDDEKDIKTKYAKICGSFIIDVGLLVLDVYNRFNIYEGTVRPEVYSQVIKNIKTLPELTPKNHSDTHVFIEKGFDFLCDAWQNKISLRDDMINDPGRKAERFGRILGIDQNNDTNKKNFKKLVLEILDYKEGSILEEANNYIKLYREITADFFMVKALNLDVLGYLYLVANKWGLDLTVSDVQMIRMLDVFLFMWCKEDLSDHELKASENVTKTVINTVKALIRNFAEKHITNEELKAQINIKLDEADETNPVSIVSDLLDCCEAISNQAGDDHVVERMRTLYKITWLFGNLIQEYKDHVLRINSQTYLRDDLLQGATSIEKSISIINSNELNNNKIVDFLSTISDSINRLSDLTESDESEINKVSLNEKSINTFWRMYYTNLQENTHLS